MLHESLVNILQKLPDLKPKMSAVDLTYKGVPNGVVYEDFVAMIAKIAKEYNSDEASYQNEILQAKTREIRQSIYVLVKRFIEEDIELRQVV